MRVYHLSSTWLGPAVVLHPRVPRDPMPGERSRVRRVCVAPTVAGCLRALRTTYYARERWVVYVSDEAETVPPLGVPDAEVTGERWILTPIRMQYAGTVSTAL